KEEGVIGAIGGGCDSVAPLLAGLERDAFDTLLCAGRYTLLDRSASEYLIPLALEKRCAIIVAGVFNSGVLATGVAPGARFDYSAAPPEVLHRVAALELACQQHGVALKAAALQFPLRNPAVGTLFLGPANLTELQDSLTHLAAAIPEAFWADADAVAMAPAARPHT
ncbi:MAG: aldo/keto reductase, partial [Variovorax sp.]